MASRRALLTVITLTLFFFASSSAREPTCHPWVKDCAAIMESSAGPAYDSNPAAVLASHNRTPRGELAQGLCYAELPDCGSSSDEGYGGSEYCASTDSEYLPVQNSTHVVGANSNNMRLGLGVKGRAGVSEIELDGHAQCTLGFKENNFQTQRAAPT